MIKLRFILSLVLLSLIISSCTNNTSGGETLNEKVALYMPDGSTPAIDAIVKFFSIGDTSTIPTHQTQTDIEGRYSVSGITSTGYYNVIAGYDDSLFSMQDTVFISIDSHYVKDDTLSNPGLISGIVKLQPNHSHLLDNVYVFALGMGRAVNVDSTGWFTITKLAAGDYNLQVDTDLENYGPRFVDITVLSSVNYTISDTITLPYSGIPVVAGINHTYDTLNGVVTISWDKSSYGDIQSYLIFRKPSSTLLFPSDPISWVSSSDTTIKDTIFNPTFSDSTTKTFDYTVAIMNNSSIQGATNSYTRVNGISPKALNTKFSYTFKHFKSNVFTDSCSINDSMQIIINSHNV